MTTVENHTAASLGVTAAFAGDAVHDVGYGRSRAISSSAVVTGRSHTNPRQT